MLTLQQTKGLKYPDEFAIKFFFKENLHQRKGRVLELGCASGNNLMIFFQFGWDCVGIDFDKQAVTDAKHNLGRVSEPGAKFRIIHHDLRTGLPVSLERCDVLLLPNVLYYLPRMAAVKCLEQAAGLVNSGGLFFLRMRSPRDYRYRRGREVEPNGFVLDISETGERDVLNVFYHEYELVDMLRAKLAADPATLKILLIDYQNLQNGVTVSNSDIVIWGRIGILKSS